MLSAFAGMTGVHESHRLKVGEAYPSATGLQEDTRAEEYTESRPHLMVDQVLYPSRPIQADDVLA